jgi:hypothetical protein
LSFVKLICYNSIIIAKDHLKDTFETCTIIEATNPQDNISTSTQEPTLDMEGNDTNTTTQEPVLALRRKKKSHVVTQEPTVNSKFSPQEPIVDMGEMIKHKR